MILREDLRMSVRALLGRPAESLLLALGVALAVGATAAGITLAGTTRAQSEALRAGTMADAAANKQRVWDEYVIGNLAFVTAPPEGRVGDLLMTLQLPKGTLRFTGDALGPVQQEWALMVFRSIIA